MSSDLFRALLSSDVERLLEVDVTELKLAVSSLLEVTHIKQSISGMDERSSAYHSFVQFSTFSFLPLYRNGAREMHTMTERNTQIRAYHFALAVRRFSRSRTTSNG